MPSWRISSTRLHRISRTRTSPSRRCSKWPVRIAFRRTCTPCSNAAESMRIDELAGKRVAIWGMGREGRAALGVLRRRLANQPLAIFCNATEARVLEGMATGQESRPGDGSAQSHGGGSRDTLAVVTRPPDAAALSAFDVVIKSPGISAYCAEIVDAQRNGTRFTSGTALWFAERRGSRVIAVTGTKGKSTTAALIAHLL